MPSSRTAKLDLPFILPAQAQKHIPHNEALQTLDALYGLSVVTDVLGEPPIGVAEGTRYLISTLAVGVWAGKENQIAIWRDGLWHFYAPHSGWVCFVQDIERVKIWSGGSWQLQQDLELNQGLTTSLLGVNATADETNRLVLSSSNALFNHEGAGHRLSINKQSATDTAALTLQTNFSTRTEIGISGDDIFRIKVSADGNTFQSALTIKPETGEASFPKGFVHAETQKPINSFVPSHIKTIWGFEADRAALPRLYMIDSLSGGTINLTTPQANTIFSDGMRNVAMVRLWNVSKSPPEACWVNYNNSDVQINVANPDDIIGWGGGETLQLGDPEGEVTSGLNNSEMVAVDISNHLFNAYGAVFKQRAVSLFLEASAGGGAGRLGASENGVEHFNVTSHPDGTENTVSFTLPCSVASPISNSHLLYFDEKLLAGALELSKMQARILGVWV